MPTPTSVEITASVVQFMGASDLAFQIVNGPASGVGSTVTVGSGDIDTFAKIALSAETSRLEFVAAGEAALADMLPVYRTSAEGEPLNYSPGVFQVEITTVKLSNGDVNGSGGTVAGDGDATVFVVASTGVFSTYDDIALTAGDSNAVVATKLAAYLNLAVGQAENFTWEGVGETLVATKKVAEANVASTNMVISNTSGSAAGLTPSSPSVNSVSGVAEIAVDPVPTTPGKRCRVGDSPGPYQWFIADDLLTWRETDKALAAADMATALGYTSFADLAAANAALGIGEFYFDTTLETIQLTTA